MIRKFYPILATLRALFLSTSVNSQSNYRETVWLQIKDKVLSVSNFNNLSDFGYKGYIKSYLLTDRQLKKFKSKRTLYKLFSELKQKLREFIFQDSLTPGPENIQDKVNYEVPIFTVSCNFKSGNYAVG